ncbi:MAG: sugar phosphate isomerase/epimerase [Clostridiales bacterium]|jgi:sugar phosphate isomerase/epimerase|nr:sugar phosphate isomerase/epimerase [Clostridiales bacterium]
MSNKDSMKIGFVGFIYSPPPEIEDHIERIKWQTAKVHELGGSVFHLGGMPLLPDDWAKIEDLKGYIDSIDVELEIGTPFVFGLTGDDKKQFRADLLNQIKKAKKLGIKIMRAGYGKLKLPTSRFNKSYPLAEHKKFVIDNLIEAGKIFESEDIYFALENHCDFLAREFVEFFTAVNNKHVGCALDTANGYTVFDDANDEVEMLAPFAVTTHIKDMSIVEADPQLGICPFVSVGCALGDGNVDIPRAIEVLDEKSPFSNGLHLIVEQGWFDLRGIEDPQAYQYACLEKSMIYLKELLGRK